MTALEMIKRSITALYRTSPDVHINISIPHPRVSLRNDPARITAVYPHVFQIEEYSTGIPRRHTLQYTDILTNQIEITEMK